MRKRLVGMLVFGILSSPVLVGEGTDMSKEKQEYELDYKYISDTISLSQKSKARDLEAYEKFADAIEKKWSPKNKAEYASLMLKICEPLNSGIFNERRQYDLAREYAILALEKPDEIQLDTELSLTGCCMTTNITESDIFNEEEFSKRRKVDSEIRLHAWRRLIDAIDPNYDLKKEILSPNAIGVAMGLPSGISPEDVKEPLRTKYESALQENRKEIERRVEQSKLHRWLEKFPKRAEDYIIGVYSVPPFNTKELEQLLNKYNIDIASKNRIFDSVNRNIQSQK